MKRKNITTIRSLILTFLLLGANQLSAQLAMNAPEPAGGSSAWTKICAGIDSGSGPFNSGVENIML
jgi:hypothetical protein